MCCSGGEIILLFPQEQKAMDSPRLIKIRYNQKRSLENSGFRNEEGSQKR